MKNQEVEIGDKVRDKITGFVGIAVSKMEFFNRCIQFGVVPRVGKDNKEPDEMFIDKNSLEIIKKKVKLRPINKEDEDEEDEKDEDDYETTGGPNHPSIRMRGY